MLSIVIVNWNTRDLLRLCLDSIGRFSPAEPHEIIVVDNASEDGSASMVASEFSHVNLIRNSTNLGYAKGNNQGISASNGEMVLTLNPDTEFFDDSLQRACEMLRSKSSVGALSGRLLNRDGTTQKSIRGFPRPWDLFCDLIGLSRLFPNSKLFGRYRQNGFDYEIETEVEQPMGTFLLYRREALDKTGMMDEQFPIFFNEVDLLMRIRKEGFTVLYSPEVKLFHEGGASTIQVKPKMIWESHRSLLKFYRKWYFRWWSYLTYPLLFVFVSCGAFIRAKGWNAGFRP